jgi:hypothetical protein
MSILTVSVVRELGIMHLVGGSESYKIAFDVVNYIDHGKD